MKKANTTAALTANTVSLPQGVQYVDGMDVTPTTGGIFENQGWHYSLAAPQAVPSASESLESANTSVDTPTSVSNSGGPYAVAANRLARFMIRTDRRTQRPTLGVEIEGARMDQNGNYVTVPDRDMAELYTFMLERGTEPTDNPNELGRRYHALIAGLVQEAANDGQLFAPLSVFGQRAPRPDEQNPHPYITDIAHKMTERTGFDTLQTFRVAGVQPHTSITNTMAAIRATEAIQYLNPILVAPSNAGPFLHGGIAANLQDWNFTSRQFRHMRDVGLTQEDLQQMPDHRESWRYVLRRLASPLAGIWQYEGPRTAAAYLADADWYLRLGKISSIDRHFGWHTDRIRAVLDGSGASTVESNAFDNFLGNAEALTSNHLLYSGILTALETMAMRGHDPREKVAKHLGLAAYSPEQRLAIAHRQSIRTSRAGNDATPYGKPVETWLRTLIELADESPHLRLTTRHRERLDNMYKPSSAVTEIVNAYRAACGPDANLLEAYYETNVGSPSMYMRIERARLRTVHAKALARDRGRTEARIVQQVELMVARALHAYMERVELAT